MGLCWYYPSSFLEAEILGLLFQQIMSFAADVRPIAADAVCAGLSC